MHAQTGYLMFAILPTVLLAPIGEEIYCRGWLWNALQRYCRPITTGTIVSAIWIAAHLPFGFHRLSLLIPHAALLAITRHYCRSVRAPILLHITVNALGLLSQPLYVLLFSGDGPVLVPPL
jgi:membrane protease YdiL (CAAX protease family)